MIKAEAENLGFLFLGSLNLEPAVHFEQYQSWLSRGLHGGMAYLATGRALEMRQSPQKIFPEAKSILSFALSYLAPESFPYYPENEPTGRVASYAWGTDYHLVIPGLLNRLVEALNSRRSRRIQCMIYTDTGPILERDLAQQAGLGWIGKNSCLLIPKVGSFLLLAELFLDEECEPDLPFHPDYCGKCTRCLEACPTQCILPNRTIDARRCVSYLTIENKTFIPLDLRPKIGNWLFGCDICQTVCPWNKKFGRQPVLPEFYPRWQNPYLNLHDAIRLSPQDFKHQFQTSPILRARRRGFIRNAVTVLGNQANPASIPWLGDLLLNEKEALIRQHSAWSLGRIATRSARFFLEKALSLEPDPLVYEEILSALG